MRFFSQRQFRYRNNSFFSGLKRKKLKKIFLITSLCLGSFLLLSFLVSLGFYFYLAKTLPDPNKIIERHIPQSTKIFDRTGQTLLYEIYGEEKRTLVDLKNIPEHLIWATIVTEDKNFYKHKGFDFKRIIAAFYYNLVHQGKTQGASTITQQLVKNTIVGQERTYLRKIKEFFLALQIEKGFSKDEILKIYLNEISYGSYLYGVEAASQNFFRKSVSQITLAEAALLAALPKGPTYYSPYGSHQDELKKRKEMILDRLFEYGYIKEEELKKAKEEKIKIYPPKEKIIAPHFVMYVKELLEEKYGQNLVEQGGLNVYTTLDLEKQRMAEEAIEKYAQRNEEKYQGKNAALVSIDPKNGQVLAMVGSRNYFDTENQGNVNVALSLRQPGSSFKPYAYAAAFEKGFTPETVLFDLETNFGPGGKGQKDYIPQNYDGKTRGPLTMKKALAGSLNIPSVKVLYLAGIDRTIELAQKMGITSLKDRSRYGLALVLGGGEVRLLEHTGAFAVFARNGIKHKITPFLKIERKGRVIEEYSDNPGERILDENIAAMINDILSDNEARSFIFGRRNYLTLSRPAAAKTGTSQDFRDGWIIGYTPNLVTGVWVGNNDNSPMKKSAFGSQTAAPIWHFFMERALKGTEIEKFETPKIPQVEKFVLNGKEFLEEKRKICRDSQKLANELCPESHLEEKTYREIHSILHYVDKEDPRGKIPSNPEKDPQYWNWEKPVRAWVEKNGLISEEIPKEYCNLHIKENKPEIFFLSPKNKETIYENTFKIKTEVSAPLGIEKVDFYLEEELIGTATTSPFAISFSNNRVNEKKIFLNGWHSLLARAFDKVENSSETKIEINFKMDIISPEISLIFPWQNSTFDASSFPLTLKAKAEDNSGISKIEFYLKNISEEKAAQLIGQAISPFSGNEYQILWQNLPQKGIYYFYVLAYDAKGNIGESEKILIEIR